MNQTFKLSLKPNDYPPEVPVVYANQYDVGRGFSATILDVDGSEYTFSSETVVICGTKPDGTGFSYDATASGHAVTFATTGQMTVVHGFVRCGIIITLGSTVIGTLAFLMYVQPAALQTDTIISSDDFGSIITDAVVEWMDDHGVVIDDTLTVSGADAKKTGDESADLKSQFDLGCITADIKEALLALAAGVGYEHSADGPVIYNNLYAALYYRWWEVTNTLSHCTSSNGAEQTLKGEPYTATITASSGYTLTGATVSVTMGGTDVTSSVYSNGVISIPAVTGALVITITAAAATLSSISATANQTDSVYNVDTLSSIKQYITVTATYTDNSTGIVPSSDYTLSGALSVGTSTLTVTYQSKTTTVDITVTNISTLTLDSVATGTKSYRDIFITGNLLPFGDFEASLSLSTSWKNWDGNSNRKYKINAGTPVQSTDEANSPTTSLKCYGGSNPYQINYQDSTVHPTGIYAMCISGNVTSHSSGGVGIRGIYLQTGVNAGMLEIANATSGWEEKVGLLDCGSDSSNSFSIYMGTGGASGSGINAYLDDVIFTPLPTGASEDVLLLLYKRYCGIRRSA